MKPVVRWLFLPLLVAAVLAVAAPRQADARVRVWVGYPGVYAGYGVYSPGIVVTPPVYPYVAPYRVYRPAVVVPRVYVPYVGPRSYYWSPYWGW